MLYLMDRFPVEAQRSAMYSFNRLDSYEAARVVGAIGAVNVIADRDLDLRVREQFKKADTSWYSDRLPLEEGREMSVELGAEDVVLVAKQREGGEIAYFLGVPVEPDLPVREEVVEELARDDFRLGEMAFNYGARRLKANAYEVYLALQRSKEMLQRWLQAKRLGVKVMELLAQW